MNDSQLQTLKQISESEDVSFLVTVLELSAKLSGVDTISEIARRNKISPNGVKASKCYRKIKIGKQMMAVKGIRDLGLPF
jgi:DNA-binding CsgD family transcriptional regulator